MELTKFTDLGLRVMMRLAVLEEDAPMTTQVVAQQLNVSYAHAAKVVARLQSLGVVETRRGRAGGLRITAAGRTMSVGRLIRELEGVDEVIECEGDHPCPLRQACRLRGLLRQAQEAFFATLDPWTLEDLTASPTGPVLLSLSARPGR
ncbi:BadM/Rrf2 family transcriptional regulator [Nocardioides sp. J9]|uniref:RrF2 family transcriptional regulator n=1 Tax=unclassified Nocardioides TaxID=2615069 RepID=UPI00048DEE06|nr:MULTISPECIES: Rrf2 family transcriptional regulator [unclassified Nocardioides]TWG92633.1 BadM/Rrf2 family transcriptional regulator [Nocardioides sp. J9]